MSLVSEEDNMLRTLEVHRTAFVLPQDRAKINVYQKEEQRGATSLSRTDGIELRRIWNYVTDNGTINTL